MADLMDAIARNRLPDTNGRGNLLTMATIEAGYHSIEQRRSVKISEILDRVPAVAAQT